MLKTALLVYACLISVLSIGQSTFRSIDGRDNNLSHPEWGSAGHLLENSCRVEFSDGLESPAGPDRANPRTISNVLVRQSEASFSESGLNDFWWAFGQFIDHDITLTGDNEEEFMGIRVPSGDPQFDPDSLGSAMIPMLRSLGDHDTMGVRQYRNEITAFIDGSGIYGSENARADYLRSFQGGKLRVSTDDLPPFNTLNGEYGAPIDANAPAMAGAHSPSQRLFVCGDVRANENSLLASLHTIWVREHNRICDSLVQLRPGSSDQELYTRARRLVGGQLQSITLNEWLPALGIEVPAYNGYNPSINPAITNEFAAAAFRFGHSLVGSELFLYGSDGQPTNSSPISLRDVFFAPITVLQQNGIDALVRGAFVHRQQQLDCEVVEDLRSFLFGNPGSGGLDLAAMNINRGRDRGVATFNSIREDLGLVSMSSFEELTGNRLLAEKLAEVYHSIDEVDAWIGFLAEEKVDGVGPTLRKVMELQFSSLRDGDRFYYENDDELTIAEKQWVSSQTLAEVINRNTNTSFSGNSFFAPVSSSTAFAKTGDSELKFFITETEVLIQGFLENERYVLSINDVSGKQVMQGTERIADGFGESRLGLNGFKNAIGIVTIKRKSGIVQSSVVVH